jgi:hypothetical protein
MKQRYVLSYTDAILMIGIITRQAQSQVWDDPRGKVIESGISESRRILFD